MTGRRRSSVLWGAVGFMAFLALVQGYALLVEPLGVGFGAVVLVAVGVGAVVAGVAYVVEHRLMAKGRV